MPATQLLRTLSTASTWEIAALWLLASPGSPLAAEIDCLTGCQERLRDATRAIESRLN